MFIYKITNNVNGKAYIGQTICPVVKRYLRHSCGKDGSAISHAIQKYGKDNFTFEVIDTAESLVELNKKEETYISTLNTISPNGYNLKPGGDNHRVHASVKQKISERTKAAMQRPEIRRKLSESGKGRTPWNKGLKTRVQVRNMSLVCKETLEVFKNQIEVALKLGISKSAVCAHIKGRIKSLKGFTFERVK